MILDAQNLVSKAQNLAQVAGNYLSPDSIDLGVAGVTPRGNTPPQDVGRVREAEFFAQVVETFTAAGANTLQVNLIESVVEVYTQPRGGKKPTYRVRTDYAAGQVVPVVLGGKPVGTLPVSEILP